MKLSADGEDIGGKPGDHPEWFDPHIHGARFFAPEQAVQHLRGMVAGLMGVERDAGERGIRQLAADDVIIDPKQGDFLRDQ